MVFDFAMFHERAPKLKGSDISKAMETVLLEQNIYTEYLAEVVCYSKKEDNATATRRNASVGSVRNIPAHSLR